MLKNRFFIPDGQDGGIHVNKHQETNVVQKIEQPKEPPAEVLARDFNVEQLPTLSDEEGKQVFSDEKGVVKEETKKEAVPKKEEKKEEEQPVNRLSKHLIPPGGKKESSEQKKEEFDYSKYSDDEQKTLKNMSAISRKYTSALMDEVKELRKQKDAPYLQHEEAYVLHPEFKRLQQTSFLARKEAAYWLGELEKAKLGKEVTDLKGWNQDGTPVLGEKIKPDDRTEEVIRGLWQNLISTEKDCNNKLGEFQKNSKNVFSNDQKAINDERAKRFSWIADSKLLDYSIQTATGEQKTIKDIRGGFINLFPSYMHNNAGVQTAADLMVALIIAEAEIKELSSKSSIVEKKLEETDKVEPSSDIRGKESGGKKVNGVSKFSLEDAGIEL